ncbi:MULTISPECIES: 16S rRNA (cytidine(1402)-2'-O)-methyltransferase [Salimicrobium]|uniref:Ribosomal RNA small subunit methyltransferase I n=1 Tax=Salimicrobium humidisoli TaxID=2029857 RepID=A0ABX4HP98_9BACI|nr:MULTISPECIES: 16S rRNA (cytidine(1402)-2'-O)-methyltransferase [Salimicrobium]PBB04925.1 16S rRNA (cytidine(1402)-2'-O)-methyltransferase [Salimicrobium humidisoli]
MKTQKSFRGNKEEGTLYIVPTPIGNLEDMTYRAVHTLQSVDKIAAEDTRNTKKLTRHYDIDTPLISYHEHNRKSRAEELIAWLGDGLSVALVSDAGMPGISDPGEEIISQAVAEDIPVVVLPGANAALVALVGSGLPADHFFYYGFLPRKKKDRVKELEKWKSFPETMVFYESPHRLKQMTQDLYEVFGDRRVSFARELTKQYEEFLRGDLSDVLTWVEETELKGEFCIVVEGGEEEEKSSWWDSLTLEEHVGSYVEEGMRDKEAVKKVAVERGMPKREVYRAYHVEED